MFGVDAPRPDDVESDEEERERELLRGIIETTGEATGAAVGGLVGLVGGPPGAVGGAIAGVAITRVLARVGSEVHERLIVRRQRERLGAGLAVMQGDADVALAAGAAPRDDGFFDAPGDGRRADAEEVLEGALRAVADANEERKVRYIAGIFPSVAVRDDISAADAHWLVKAAEQLSWRQMLVLAIVADAPAERFKAQKLESEDRGLPCASATLAEEVEDLARLGLVGQVNSTGAILRAGMTWGSLGSYWAVPMVSWRPTAAGALLVETARLGEIDCAEQDAVVGQLLEQDDTEG